MGIVGNEKADLAAKAGLKTNFKLEISYSIREVKSMIKSVTNTEYNTSFKKWNHTKYYKIQPQQATRVHNYHNFRRVDVAITRLRLNNIRNNVYLHKIGRAPNNLCCHCKTPDTIQHILFECKLYAKQRNNLISNASNPNNPDLLLADKTNYPHLAKFLLQTNLYKKI